MYQLYTQYQLGETADIRAGDRTHPCLITAVTHHHGGRVCYQVAWWDGGTRYCEWVEECELSARPYQPTPAGFHAMQSQY